MSDWANERETKRSLRVYPALRELCLEYAFWPRQQLPIEDLANALSSSATPVREALARLAGEGLVDSILNKGYVAKPLCADETRWNVDLLFMLLVYSVQHGSENPIIGDQQGSSSTLALANHTFSQIGRMSNNVALSLQVERLLELTRFVRKLYLENVVCDGLVRELTEDLSLARGDRQSAVCNLVRQQTDLRQHLSDIVREGRLRSMSGTIPLHGIRCMPPLVHRGSVHSLIRRSAMHFLASLQGRSRRLGSRLGWIGLQQHVRERLLLHIDEWQQARARIS